MRWPWQKPEPEMELEQAGITAADFAEFLRSGGLDDYDLENLYRVDSGTGRISYPTFNRCVDVIASSVGAAITQGDLYVVNRRTGDEVDLPRTRAILRLFTSRPNGRDPALTWVQDCVRDMIVTGNSLIWIQRVGDRPVSLERMHPVNVYTVGVPRSREYAYQVRYADEDDGDYMMVPRMDIVHARWGSPIISRSLSGTTRRLLFADHPVRLLRPALELGRQGDKYVLDFFKQGASRRSSVAITYPEFLNEDQIKRAKDELSKSNPSKPLVLTGNPKVSSIVQTAQNPETEALRRYQVIELARFFGIPAPLIGENVTNWGQGVHELRKLFWVFSGRPRMDDFLAALGHAILPPEEEFAVNDLDAVRGDLASIGAIMGTALGDGQRPGWMTVREARRLSKLPKDPDGDLHRPEQMEETPRTTPEEGDENE